jgi:hypothetical protein
MEGWKSWRKRILVLVGSAGLIILGSPTTVTAYWGRWGTQPAILRNQGPVVILPTQQSGGGTQMPPAEGSGETGPTQTTPPTDPALGTPEPASLVTALIGAGLAFGYGWRQRRKNAVAA